MTYRRALRFYALCGAMLVLLGGGIAHSDVVINEFVASNREGLQDEDGAYPDWIELYNSGGTAVPLLGWSLTDDPGDPDRWTFPDVGIGSGQYLVVFASGKDRRPTGGGNLHTNFELDASGEYLALYNAGGVPQTPSVFDPQYPPQAIDVSYGLYAATDEFRYFDTPTPGAPNVGNSYTDYAGRVEFSRSGGTFTDPFSVELATDAPGGVIRYTLDGSLPTETSAVYTNPIAIGATTQVRAQASGPDMLPGPVVSESYLALDADVQDFESNVPLVVVDSFGEDILPTWSTDLTTIACVFIDTDEETGRARITDDPEYAGRGGLRIRGASTAGYPKKQYKFETWDEYDDDTDVSLLGFPSESDWIIHGPYSDKTLMRNYLMYTWSNQIGRYAVRTRFIEVFLNTGSGEISMSDYVGAYVFMETIKRGPRRVDIAPLEPHHNSEPEITGGYMLSKYDGPGLTTSVYHDELGYEEPEEDEITPQQEDWLRDYFDEFETALSGPNFDDPVDGYARYIDAGSFIDHHILVELAKNVDGFLISTYLYKDRGGKISMGPIWDYNGSLGGANYFCSCQTDGWHYEFDEANCPECREGNEVFPWPGMNSYRWYERIMEDPEFLLQYADRWFDLREDHFTTANILADIDENVAILTDNGAPDNPVERNFARWDILDQHVWPNYIVGGSYEVEIDWMKTWLGERLDWMDWAIAEEYGAAPPIFYVEGVRLDTGGHVEPGDSLTMELPDGATGTIYYTLDGSDPRVRGTPPEVAGSATEYTGAVTLTEATHIKARIRDGDVWSALNRATFYTRDLRDALRVTEIMYHPAGGDAEFIELQHVGSNPEDISGVYFSEGIEFTFPANTILQPGEYVVLVSSEDESDFASQYPGVAIGGLYEFKLDNGGERIDVRDANGGVLISFTYDDDPPWPIETDGLGYSLVRVDLEGDPNDPASWSASRQVGGSPGEPESDVTAAFTANPTNGSRPLTVEFTDESVGPVASWSWDFGDGTASTEQNPSHTYYLAGDHTVTLSVSSPNGFDTETGVVHADEEVSVETDRYKTIVDDIKVTYNRGGCLAWHNELDDTLRIEVLEDGGTLNLTAGEDAATYWDSRCDVYIYAPDVSIKKINLKGRPETQLYVCGQVGYVKNFVLKYGHVGDTLSYGPEVGLGSAALDPPKKILIKAGWSTAAVLGIGYPELRFDPEGAEGEVGTVEMKPKPFEMLVDDDDQDGGVDRAVVADAEAPSVETKAAYSYERGDIKVLYSKPGCEAEYNSDDDILMIRISESDGDLTVKFGKDVYYYWDDYCDVYIDAPDVSINTMILKGRPETQLYVCGEVGSVNNFKLKHGSVGDTGHYGPDFGLVNTSLALPTKIKILWGWATAPVLGVYEE